MKGAMPMPSTRINQPPSSKHGEYKAPRKRSISGGTSFFSNHVKASELQNSLVNLAKSRNCDLADVNYFDGDASYAGVSYEGAVGTCFGSSRMSVSAILVPRKAANKEGN